jgi:hypothetical protein
MPDLAAEAGILGSWPVMNSYAFTRNANGLAGLLQLLEAIDGTDRKSE